MTKDNLLVGSLRSASLEEGDPALHGPDCRFIAESTWCFAYPQSLRSSFLSLLLSLPGFGLGLPALRALHVPQDFLQCPPPCFEVVPDEIYGGSSIGTAYAFFASALKYPPHLRLWDPVPPAGEPQRSYFTLPDPVQDSVLLTFKIFATSPTFIIFSIFIELNKLTKCIFKLAFP